MSKEFSVDLGVNDAVVFVTGASTGIGQAVACRFAREGARVAIATHTDRDGCAQVRASLAQEGCPEPILVDYALDSPTSITAAVQAIATAWGRLDILAACAWESPGWTPPDTPMESIPDTVWQQQLQTNLRGTVNTITAALPHMRQRNWGRVVLISSAAAEDGASGLEPYATAKAALGGLVISVARNAGRNGVLANAVLPGLVATERHRKTIPEATLRTIAERTPTGHLATVEDIANLAAFLASAANSSITGACIRASGGLRM
jgi:NAD(P)-dependent dehydrogenase (short-subunit alcohol dehydrogenase family)